MDVTDLELGCTLTACVAGDVAGSLTPLEWPALLSGNSPVEDRSQALVLAKKLVMPPLPQLATLTKLLTLSCNRVQGTARSCLCNSSSAHARIRAADSPLPAPVLSRCVRVRIGV